MKRAKGKSNISIVKDMLEGNRPFTQVGYKGPVEARRAEGDIWTDDKGKTWIKTDGGIRSHNPQANIIKDEIKKMWICKCCNSDIRWSNNPMDEKILMKTGRCYDCNIEYETNLKIQGKFKEYELKKVSLNELSYLKDIKDKLTEALRYAMENKVIKCTNSSGLSVDALQNLAMTTKGNVKEHLKKDFEMVTYTHSTGMPTELPKEARNELLDSLSSDLDICNKKISGLVDLLKTLEHVEI